MKKLISKHHTTMLGRIRNWSDVLTIGCRYGCEAFQLKFGLGRVRCRTMSARAPKPREDADLRKNTRWNQSARFSPKYLHTPGVVGMDECFSPNHVTNHCARDITATIVLPEPTRR